MCHPTTQFFFLNDDEATKNFRERNLDLNKTTILTKILLILIDLVCCDTLVSLFLFLFFSSPRLPRFLLPKFIF